jgi:hypothetical protein
MVRHNDHESINSSSKYPTISTSMTSNVAPLRRAARNLISDFSTVQPHTIIELMQRLAPEGTSLARPVQQGAELTGQIRIPDLESVVCAERLTSNVQPHQQEPVQARSVGHSQSEWKNTTSSSPAGMHIQFRTLTFHNRPKEQLQERLRLKKFVISFLAAIRALGSPL